MPSACKGASKTSPHVSCLLQTGILLLPFGHGWLTVRHRTPAASPLGRGKRPFFRRCPPSGCQNPGALGLSQVHGGANGNRCSRRAPHDPAVPGPSSAQFRTRGPVRPLPNFQMPASAAPEGGRELHVRAAHNHSGRAGPDRATHPAPGSAPLPPQREPAPQQSRQVP